MYVCGYVQSTRNVQPIKKEDCRKIDLNPQNNYRLGKEISIYGWEWLTLRVQTRDHQWFQQFSENRIFERSKSDFRLYLARSIYHVKLYSAFYNFDHYALRINHSSNILPDLKCLVLVHCTGPEMFCAGPNILSQTKNLTAFSASSKTFVQAQKTILLKSDNLFCLAQNVCDCLNM